MIKYSVLTFILCFLINNADCGVYGRNSERRKNPSIVEENVTNKIPQTNNNGMRISAWGIITIILLIIFLMMGGYYGLICYPIICHTENNYDIMEAESTAAGTPTRSAEKLGYSSRSITPSKSNE